MAQNEIVNKGNSYVYFALTGEDFDPNYITNRIGVNPTSSWRKGDKGKYKPILENSGWKISTKKGVEYLMLDSLVDEIIEKLFERIGEINEVKRQFNLDSVLEIVMYVDVNDEQSTPSLGHDLKTLEFLYRTQTTTDIDIYRFNSVKT